MCANSTFIQPLSWFSYSYSPGARMSAFGVVDGNRKQSDKSKLLEFFLNLLSLSVQSLADKPFVDTPKGARHTNDHDFSHSEVPFDNST